MKGLIIKDCCLMVQRKRSLILLLIVGVLMAASTEHTFFVGWMALIGSLFAGSSIAYDEHDNCYPFLMTLPASRKCYVSEKYVFGIACAAAFWLVGVILCAVLLLVTGTSGGFAGEALTLFILLLLPILIVDLCIPFDLKYGAEKGRLYMLIAWGIVFAAVFVVTKYTDIDQATSVGAADPSGSGLIIAAAALLITAGATVLSIASSMRIMAKKEF